MVPDAVPGSPPGRDSGARPARINRRVPGAVAHGVTEAVATGRAAVRAATGAEGAGRTDDGRDVHQTGRGGDEGGVDGLCTATGKAGSGTRAPTLAAGPVRAHVRRGVQQTDRVGDQGSAWRVDGGHGKGARDRRGAAEHGRKWVPRHSRQAGPCAAFRAHAQRGTVYRRRSGTASSLMRSYGIPAHTLHVTQLIVGSRDE
jgi:hypothetical protein